MRFVIPVMGLVIIALLFANFYPSLRYPLRVSTSELAESSHPASPPVLIAAPTRTPGITSPPVPPPSVETKAMVEAQAASEVEPTLQAEPEMSVKIEPATPSAPKIPAAAAPAASEALAKVEPTTSAVSELPTKIEPAVNVARAQAPTMKKKRVISSQELFRQNPTWLVDDETFMRYLFFGR
jgi:hypothetical protein